MRQWFTFKDHDSRERCECRTEFEEGVTDRFQLGLYVADWRYTDNDSGKDEAEWRTAGLEGIDSMTGPNKDVLGSALYGEVRLGPEKFALEGKLLLQKEGGPAITFRGGGAGFAEGQALLTNSWASGISSSGSREDGACSNRKRPQLHSFGSRNAYSPRSAGLPSGFEPRFRSVRLRPLTTVRCWANHSSIKDRLPRIAPLVKCCTRRVRTSTASRRSLEVVRRSLVFSETPRRTTVPSSRVRAVPCPPRIAR